LLSSLNICWAEVDIGRIVTVAPFEVSMSHSYGIPRYRQLVYRRVEISSDRRVFHNALFNALLHEIAEEERLILIEDMSELDLNHENSVGLLAERGRPAHRRLAKAA